MGAGLHADAQPVAGDLEHQWPVAEALGAFGAAVNLGWFWGDWRRRTTQAVRDLLADPRRRTEMAANGRAILDGRGVDRVLSLLAKSEGATEA